MKWAVKTAKGRHVPHDTREEAEASRQRYIECDVSFADSTVVRVLSHEEAKRKAAAVELCAQAQRLYAMAEEYDPQIGDDGYDDGSFNEGHGSGLSAAAHDLEERAEALWPALFHAGDGRKPRGK